MELLPDVRYALRAIGRRPTFALAAVVTLALGVGANAAVFRVAWQTMLKPLPYPQPARLVRVWEEYARNGRSVTNTVAPGNFVDWQRGTHSFEAFAAYTALRSTLNLTGEGEPRQVDVRYVTNAYFRVFGVAPLTGRALADADMSEGTAPVVLSEHLWREAFGGDHGIVGRTIVLSGQAHPVAGVMPQAFGVAAGPTVDVWIGMALSPAEAQNRGAHYLGIVARLEPAATIDSAIADVRAVARRDSTIYPSTNRDTSATVTSIEAERGGTLRSAVGLLAGAAFVVLLVACANLASLEVAQGLDRAREFGIRTALGASRARLTGQLVIEGGIIAAMGAAAGLAMSSWILRAIARVAPASLTSGSAPDIDIAAIAAAAGLACVSVAMFAALPAWRAAGRAARWMHGRATTSDRRTAAVRTALVTVQLALAIMLLVAGALLVTSLARVLRIDPGFDPSGVVAFDVSAPRDFDARHRLFQDVFHQVEGIPGTTGVCGINAAPFDETFNMTYVPEGQTRPVGAFPRTVTSGCFDVLRLQLLAGRLFSDHETARVGIVTEGFARRAWPDGQAVGRRVHLGVFDGALIEIVGVVADSHQRSLETAPYPQFYEVESAAAAFPPSGVLVRTALPPTSIFNAVRTAVRRVDPDQPVARLRRLDDAVGSSLAERRFNLWLFAAFGAIALALASVGIYGLSAHLVARRRAEIGIRLALGAAPADVVRLVLRRAWLAVTLGIAAGLVGAFAVSGLLRHLLFALSPTEPVIYGGTAFVLGMIAMFAAWIPARRAARVDPAGVLRDV